jgi:hypothetical protein
MINATRGTSATRAVPDVSRNTVRSSKQTSSDAFHGLFANVTAAPALSQGRRATVSVRNNSPARAVHNGIRGESRPAAMPARGTNLLQIDVTKSAAQPTFTTTKNLVEIPMYEPVRPVEARPAAPAADSETSSVPPSTDIGDTIAKLTQAMQDFGIDTSKLAITAEEYSNNNPGGVWTDRELKVSTQDGKSVLLAVDLLQKNYAVGACDVQRMLNYKPPV